MDMYVIDDTTMQELLRFVKAHHTWVRHNLVIRQRVLEMGCLLHELKEIAEKYMDIIEHAQREVEQKKSADQH